MFIGYPPGTKGYKVWLIEDDKCVVSTHVKFHEDLVYKDVLKHNEISL